MKSNKPIWCILLITALCAAIEVGILYLLVQLDIITYDETLVSTVPMIITAVIYYIASGVLLLFHRPRLSMWLAIFVFILECIFVLYSKTIFDGFTFIVCISGLLSSMTVLNAFIELKEKGKVEVFDVFKK